MQKKLQGKYHEIMSQEQKISPRLWWIPDSQEIYHTVWQISQFAQLSYTPRSYIKPYSVMHIPNNRTPESVAAHTNLVVELARMAWNHIYGPGIPDDNEFTKDQFTSAALRHDLAEGVFGDEADDDKRDEAAKKAREQEYHFEFSQHSPSRECDDVEKVNQLLVQMEEKSSALGRLLFLADKLSAIIITLHGNLVGDAAMRSTSDPTLSERDKKEMALCDEKIVMKFHDIFTNHRNQPKWPLLIHWFKNLFKKDKAMFCLASEMWTIDFLKMREFTKYDDYGYFTALLVMYTLYCRDGKWYNWREKDYT